MKLKVVGLNHRTCPLPVREKLSLESQSASDILQNLKQDCHEVMLLSTCNRVEFIVHEKEIAAETLFRRYAKERGLDSKDIDDSLSVHGGVDAVRHLFAMASSLDSMVLGETQILNQLKAAYHQAQSQQVLGKLLNRVMQRSFHVAKKVHGQTALSEGHVSVASLAVQLSQALFGSLNNKKLLVLGAGETGQLILTHLKHCGVSQPLILNRDPQRAHQLATKFEGQARSWDELPSALLEADMLVCAAGGGQHIESSLMKKVMAKRRTRALHVIDVAVPRNTAPSLDQLSQVYVHHMDDLSALAAAEAKRRRAHEIQAWEVVDQAVSAYLNDWRVDQKAWSLKTVVNSFENYWKKRLGDLPEQNQIIRQAYQQEHLSFRRQLHPVLRAMRAGQRPIKALSIDEVSAMVHHNADTIINKRKQA